jgi:acyl-CoA synthetase (NDP forming)
MRLLGPNTIGLVNLTDNIVLSATGALEMDHFPIGSIGVVSQSGGILGPALAPRTRHRTVKLISTSNEVDLELADFIDYLADDDATKVMSTSSRCAIPRSRAAAIKAARAGNRSSHSRSGARKRAQRPLFHTPARWQARIECTTRCSSRLA